MKLDRIVARAARRRADRARDERRWQAAAAGYRRWLAVHADDAPIWKQLGHMLGEAGDLAGAEGAYAVADGLAPDDADLFLCRGTLAFRHGERERAVACYRRSLAIDGNDAARRQLAELGEGAALADAPEEREGPDPSAREATPDPAGAIEYIGFDVVHGWLDALRDDDAVEFRRGDALVARALPDRTARRGGGIEFRTILRLDEASGLRALRASDGRELAGSPFEARPRPHPAERPAEAATARIEVVVPPALPERDEIALLVTHSPNGAPKPHILPYVRALAEQGIATLLIVVTDRPFNAPAALRAAAAGILVRENAGYDFAAWAHALRLHPEAWGASILYLLNDSVLPSFGERLSQTIARVRASPGDLVGLTGSHEYRWHLQTYFIALKPGASSRARVQAFFRNVAILEDKDAVIRAYELRLTEEAERAGCAIDLLFPSAVAFNPMLRGWRALLAEGFPFVKLLLLRGAFPEVETAGWREALGAAGFDTALADATIRASAETVPADAGTRLLAHERPQGRIAARGAKVAFYGPWNYDNGLGFAARGAIAALRHAGVRLSLHPVRKPFHVHRPLAPAVDVADFAGDADVAIVHLNPDSWHLLDDEQRRAIGRAGRRIGYWVWEMAHIPDAWWHEFGSVDRIWAPSRYCAALFRAQDGPPVDIVPHVVPLPGDAAVDRAAALAGIGVDPARRIILYIFDGSSYLVRKNPAALVRAFAASGLAAQGWTLVLKTKHLHDRPEAGRAFAEMVADERAVALVDRAMPAAELRALVAAADIYASPHASEGFGLTIAEAMAAGRPVVATDFGGSTDFLDDETGYPVRAHSWVLDEDHGHYTSGGAWGRIDEPALAAALARAAADVEAGDTRRGDRARERVVEALSPDAVADAMLASFAAIGGERIGSHTVRPLPLNLAAGVAIEHGSGDDRVRLVPIARDGSVPKGLAIPDAEWIGFAPAGTIASPLLARRLLDRAAARRDVDLFYADDAAVRTRRPVEQVRRKPEFDETLLAAQDYIGAPLFVRGPVLSSLGGLDPARGTAAIADLVFRAHRQGRSIARIPEVLLAHPGDRVVATPDDYRAMLRAQPALDAFEIADGRGPGNFTLRRRFAAGAEPDVTILVPTRRTPLPDGAGSYVERLLGCLARTDWPGDRLHVIVGDDIAGSPGWEGADWPFRLTRIETPRGLGEPFNYAAKMNRLWRAATTEQIVFLNDDLHAMRPGWLKAVQTFALDEGVGGVGARLLFEDGTLQHAGLAPHAAGAAHAWLAMRPERSSYFDWADVHREWSMVTGAVFATRRSVMALVGGFDEIFDLEFNDTDLCLRLRAAGYRIVCTPDAEMTHTEKASRGETLPRGDTLARFTERWAGWLADDPAWHPRLSRQQLDAVPLLDPDTWYVA